MRIFSVWPGRGSRRCRAARRASAGELAVGELVQEIAAQGTRTGDRKGCEDRALAQQHRAGEENGKHRERVTAGALKYSGTEEDGCSQQHECRVRELAPTQ